MTVDYADALVSCSLNILNAFWQYAAIEFVGSARLVQKLSRLSFRLIAAYCGKMSVGGSGSPLGKGKLPIRVAFQAKGKDFVPMDRGRNPVGKNSKESTGGCWRLAYLHSAPTNIQG